MGYKSNKAELPKRRGRKIERKCNIITVRSLNSPENVTLFLKNIYNVYKRGYYDVFLDFKDTTAVFPNASLPISAAIQYYREQGVRIVVKDCDNCLSGYYIDRPLDASKETLRTIDNSFSKCWKFNSDQISDLVDLFIKNIQERTLCERGVVQAFEWCVYEVMDNILNHSGCKSGFVMAQFHSNSQHLAICVSDYGCGIYNTLSMTDYRPRTHIDAITMAIKKNVTRDKNIGQGNGLAGLTEIVRLNSGILSIRSGNGQITFRDGEIKQSLHLPYLSRKNHGTTIDFQIDLNKEIELSKALWGHCPTNIRLEKMESDLGKHVVSVKSESRGTGTRHSAQALRNFVLNMVSEGASNICLDFSDVSLITSSYADELVGKLVTHFGFYQYQRIFKLENMSDTIQAILHRSVAQRMAQSIR